LYYKNRLEINFFFLFFSRKKERVGKR